MYQVYFNVQLQSAWMDQFYDQPSEWVEHNSNILSSVFKVVDRNRMLKIYIWFLFYFNEIKEKKLKWIHLLRYP